jgi:EAL domain-containing protein (putative c-di-GMP-specific phosphodiesterase class I)
MALVRSISTDPVRQAIVQGILGVCKALNIEVIAEGVETNAELQKLLALGINYYQGYLFAKPEYETLPNVTWPIPNIG